MIIKPEIKGVIARTAHPFGCQQAILEQISKVKASKQVTSGPKRVLILGASSGFGLASRISLAFGGSHADTIGVSFERGPSEKGVGTAGWYNNIFFRQEAEKLGLVAKNIVADAFSPKTREAVIEAIQQEFDGKVDLVIYSLATGVRPKPDSDEMWRSVIKTTDSPVTGHTVNLETNSLVTSTVDVATEAEISATEKVMGGEDWLEWMKLLSDADVLAKGCKTVAYSYIGAECTYPIYHHGTLGRAKTHLHDTRALIDESLSSVNGQAHIAICKALVTKASVFIPAFSPYILALFKVMKQKGTHEGCIEQMQRLFSERMYIPSNTDSTANVTPPFIRMDDWELDAETQRDVNELMSQITPENFTDVGDYEGYKSDFLQLNGFGFDNIDYGTPIDMEILKSMCP